jgi:shikimate kinase
MNLVLIGYRCTGKTTAAEILAEKLGWPLVDTDALVQERAGKSIDAIVAEGGWEAFRDAETAVIRDVASGDRQVISAGGGAVLRDENRQALKASAKVVLLRADAETIWRRMQGDQKTTAQRPDLTDTGGIDEIRHLLDERRDVYREASDFAISTDTFEPSEVTGRILAWLKLSQVI